MKANQAAFDTGQLAERLAQGYYAHLAAITVATDSKVDQLIPTILPGFTVPVGTVERKDGSAHVFHFTHFLQLLSTDPLIKSEIEKSWFTGSLLRLGDLLAQHNYFDRAPELELVRHLRNGIAHGNRFRIDDPSRLTRYPAHNRLALVKGDPGATFEIAASLQNQPVLFDFMGAGDVLDLLMSVGLYLVRMGNGDPLRP